MKIGQKDVLPSGLLFIATDVQIGLSHQYRSQTNLGHIYKQI